MITDIRLQNFRSYVDESFEFEPCVNIIVGPNGSGKTNLLEAILVACAGNSYRTKDGDLIRFEQPWARLDTHAAGSSRTVKIVWDSPARVIKTFEIDKKIFMRLSLQHSLPVVL